MSRRENPDVMTFLEVAAIGAVGYFLLKAFQTAAQGVSSLADMGAFEAITQPASIPCAAAALANAYPFGTGAEGYPDSYVIPCAGASTVGMMRATGASDSDIMSAIATGACACYAAKQKGLSVVGNVIQGA